MKLTLINVATAATTTSPTITTEELALKSTNDKSLQRESISVQATIAGTGALTATVLFQAQNDDLAWITLNTFSLSGTTLATAGYIFLPAYRKYRAQLTAITGTGAAVTVTIGA